MNKITDMLGQEVQIGDRIAKAHNGSYGAEMRIGTVVDIRKHRLNMRNGKGAVQNPLKEVLLVRWENSSEKVAALERWDRDMAERKAKGRNPPHVGWDHPFPDYKVKTTPLYVEHRAFLKLG